MTARTARPGHPSRPPRAGFTLIELMVVVLIIAILIAVAFPAYQAVISNTRTAQVRSEMAAINGAIAQFKAQYNSEPPSYIKFQTAAGGTPGSPAALAPETKAILRKMFPQINLAADSPIQASLTQAGLWGEELHGIEALVFFLGGVRQNPGTPPTPATLTDEAKDLIGFSKNPQNPFAQPGSGQSNRIKPMFEFDTGRLLPSPDVQVVSSNPRPLVYRDRLSPSNPYIYASTATTGTYRDGGTAATSDFPVGFKAYRKTSATGPFWNPNSYQLISAGPDGEYGNGGVYDPDKKSSLDQEQEFDNLANFADGPLGG